MASRLKGPAFGTKCDGRLESLSRDSRQGKNKANVRCVSSLVLEFTKQKKRAGASVSRRPRWPTVLLHSSRMWMFSGFLGHSWRRRGGKKKTKNQSPETEINVRFALRSLPIGRRGPCQRRGDRSSSRSHWLITNNVHRCSLFSTQSSRKGGRRRRRFHGHDHRLTRVHVYAQHKL